MFKRHELKYLLDPVQKERILDALRAHMEPDRYGRTTIRNIYYDTDTFRLVRRSIERPVYKEKLRLRSYGPASPESGVFVELKKKYDGVVYKRRLVMPEREAVRWLAGEDAHVPDTQIAREIAAFLAFYRTLRPVCLLSCEREAYACPDGSDFRVTFDENILSRPTELDLTKEAWRTPLLEPDRTLMEVKTSGAVPLWMVHAMTEAKAARVSFSKYGEAYRTQLFPETLNRIRVIRPEEPQPLSRSEKGVCIYA